MYINIKIKTYENDLLSKEKIIKYLYHNLFIDQRKINLLFNDLFESIVIFKSIDSTNSIAKQIATNNLNNARIIIADTQTNGYGRFKRKFYSPSGHGVYLSFILKATDIPFNNIRNITIYIALAVAHAIEDTTNIAIKIKWVNDIYVENKKIGGILCESVIDSDTGFIKCIVAGIGINIKKPISGFDPTISSIAGAISDYGELIGGRNRLIAHIIKEIMHSVYNFNEINMINEYRNRMCILNKYIKVSQIDCEYDALAIDIDDQGCLIVKKNDGSVECLSTGEVSVHYIN